MEDSAQYRATIGVPFLRVRPERAPYGSDAPDHEVFRVQRAGRVQQAFPGGLTGDFY